MHARRDTLRSVRFSRSAETGTHLGLWLDKYLPEQQESDSGDGENVKAAHIESVEEAPLPEGYREAYARWRAAFTVSASEEANTIRVEAAKVAGRMVIGLGMRGALEAGIQLHHTWGVPFIPGSALKGVAAAAAHQLVEDPDWRKTAGDSEKPQETLTAHEELFGTTALQGSVIFHDAWLEPTPKVPIHLDVMTVHHPDYYQATGSKIPAPSDTDSPTPIPFISASGTYTVVVEAATPEWADAALDLLKLGLDRLGVGAKTLTGYGRLKLGSGPPATPAQATAAGSKSAGSKPAGATPGPSRNASPGGVVGEFKAWLSRPPSRPDGTLLSNFHILDEIERTWLAKLTALSQADLAAIVTELQNRITVKKARARRNELIEVLKAGKG